MPTIRKKRRHREYPEQKRFKNLGKFKEDS